MRQVLKNCQLTVFRWCSDGSKFVTDNSDHIRRSCYNRRYCLRQLKRNLNCLNGEGTRFLCVLFYPERTRLMFARVVRRYVASTVLVVSTPMHWRTPAASPAGRHLAASDGSVLPTRLRCLHYTCVALV